MSYVSAVGSGLKSAFTIDDSAQAKGTVRVAELTEVFFTYVFPHELGRWAGEYKHFYRATLFPIHLWTYGELVRDANLHHLGSYILALSVEALSVFYVVQHVQGVPTDKTVCWIRYNVIVLNLMAISWKDLSSNNDKERWKAGCEAASNLMAIAREILILTCPAASPVVHVAKIATPLFAIVMATMASEAVIKELGIKTKQKIK